MSAHSSSYHSDDEEQPVVQFTERGRRMAAAIAEYVLMRYFFPGIKDRKKTAIFKQAFLSDMQFNLSTGKVEKACKRLRNPLVVDTVHKIYSDEKLL